MCLIRFLIQHDFIFLQPLHTGRNSILCWSFILLNHGWVIAGTFVPDSSWSVSAYAEKKEDKKTKNPNPNLMSNLWDKIPPFPTRDQLESPDKLWDTVKQHFNKNKTLKWEENTLLSRENHVYCYNTEEQTGWVVQGRTGTGTEAGSWLNRGHLGTNKRQNDRLYEAAVPSPRSKTHIKKENLKNSLKTNRQKHI